MSYKEQHLALSYGIGLAGNAVSNFLEELDLFFDVFSDEIIIVVVKP